MPYSQHIYQLPLALLILVLAGCGGTGEAAAPTPGEPVPDARGVPGFDTRDYPGDAVMTRWLEESPYRWVGYYLPAPCYTGTSWQGKRSTLRDMGWGMAVLFVGEQDWRDPVDAVSDTLMDPAVREAPDRCTRSNLTPERGRADGAAAASVASAEGFPAGTVVYLDVEPVDVVSDSLAAYVAEWTEGLIDAGYAPGLYAHARNADTLIGHMTAAAEAAGADQSEPRLWVASTRGFNLRRGPTESGYPATIWQGILDAEETWGGTTLRIDQNVADRADPSG